MKYIKQHESFKDIYKLYDYVICRDANMDQKFIPLNNFLSNNVGQIINTSNINLQKPTLIVHYPQLYDINNEEFEKLEDFFVLIKNQNDADKYFDMPSDFTKMGKGGLRGFLIKDNEIIAHDSNKEILELILQANKYNL